MNMKFWGSRPLSVFWITTVMIMVILVLTSMSFSVAFGWTNPTPPPPSNNVDAPITVGPGQIKAGGLGLNMSGLSTYGLIVGNGNVGIGTTNPRQPLEIRSTFPIVGSMGFGNDYRDMWFDGGTDGAYTIVNTAGPSGMTIFQSANSVVPTGPLDLPKNLLTLNNDGRLTVGPALPDPKSRMHIYNDNPTTGMAELFIDTLAGRGSNIVYGHAGIKEMFAGTKQTGDFVIGSITDPVAGSGVPHMVIKKGTGRIGIGNSSLYGQVDNPTYLLTVMGTAGKVGGGTWTNASDIRLKDVAGSYERGLPEILKLNPVTYHYKKDNARGLPSDEEQYGFVAQEVMTIFPEAVTQSEDGYYDFNMHPINVALVNAIKEQQQEIENLRRENEELKKLSERVSKIEQSLSSNN